MKRKFVGSLFFYSLTKSFLAPKHSWNNPFYGSLFSQVKFRREGNFLKKGWLPLLRSIGFRDMICFRDTMRGSKWMNRGGTLSHLKRLQSPTPRGVKMQLSSIALQALAGMPFSLLQCKLPKFGCWFWCNNFVYSWCFVLPIRSFLDVYCQSPKTFFWKDLVYGIVEMRCWFKQIISYLATNFNKFLALWLGLDIQGGHTC